MSQITPEYIATLSKQELLDLWYAKTLELVAAKETEAEEQMLRRAIAAAFFPVTQEGVNNCDLTDGYVLKATVQYTRKVDKAAFLALRADLEKFGVNPDTVVRWEPALETKVYKGLSKEALALMDTVVTAKSGLPAIEIVLPKRNRGA